MDSSASAPRPSALIAARAFIKKGWSPIPVPYREKGPSGPGAVGWQTWRVTEANVTQYFNGKLQNISLLQSPLSGGLSDTDLDCPEARLLAPHFLPPTGMIHGRPSSPRSHWWYLVEGAEYEAFRDVDGTMLGEIRAGNHITVVPPSVHPSGEPYLWNSKRAPARVGADARRRAMCELMAASILARHWPARGSRQPAALALAGGLLRAGWDVPKTAAFIEHVCEAAADDEPDKRVATVAGTDRALKAKKEVTGWPRLKEHCGAAVVKLVRAWLAIQQTYSPSDAGNAERFADQHDGAARYCKKAEAWYVWSGQRWAPDDANSVVQRAKETARSIYAEAAKADDSQAVAKFALKSEGAERLRAMLFIAQTEPGIATLPQEFDADPWVLNCHNGTLELKSGTLRPHRPRDLLTKLAGAPYVPDACDPRWDSFVATAIPDPDVRHWIHKFSGYSLTGAMWEKAFIFLWGPPDAGKSTYLMAGKAALGDYAADAPFTTWLKTYRSEGAIRNDVAKLHGARIISSLEASKDRTVDEDLVNKFVGGDPVSARFLFHEEFTYQPQGKLWWAANHPPKITDDVKDGIWTRLRIVPFTTVLPLPPDGQPPVLGIHRDKTLLATIQHDLELRTAILAWMVDGCRLWQEEGLGTCPAVEQATREYRDEMDVLEPFLDECVTFDPADWRGLGAYRGWVATSILRSTYDAWCTRRRVRGRLSDKEIAERLLAHDCTLDRRGKGGPRGYSGLELRGPGGSQMDLGE